MSRFHDFDADLEPIKWKAKGKNYEIEGDPAAKPILAALADGSLNDPKNTKQTLGLIAGEEAVDQMLDDGIGIRTLTKLSEWLTFLLGFSDENPFGDDADRKLDAGDVEDDPGNGSRSPTSSTDGEPSPQISGVSTASVPSSSGYDGS